MSQLRRFAFCLLLVGIISLLVSGGAAAQESWRIRVNLVTTLERPSEMIARIYFGIFDPRTSRPVMDVDVSSVQLALTNTGFTAQGEIKPPDIPIYVTLVLDSSGSMANSAQLLRDAAKQALSNIPSDGLFAVIQFDEEVKILQDFTENLSAIEFAIDQYKVNQRGTCMYDAAYAAIEAMKNLPSGRRAVILFTDGKDEKTGGVRCSQHTYQELIDLAMLAQVPINTIGLAERASNINAVELQGMANSTGGYSATGGQADMAGAFSLMMDSLKSQWMAEAIIYPLKGNNNGILTLTLKDGTVLTSDVVIASNTEYSGPPSPVSARLDGLNYDPDAQQYNLQFSMSGSELVGYVKVSVWDQQAGLKVDDYLFNDPQSNNVFPIPTNGMTAERDYELRIIAVSRADNNTFVLGKNDRGDAITEIVHEFTYDPTPFLPAIEIQSVSQVDNDLVLSIAVSNAARIASYDGWLVSEETSTQVAGSGFSFTALEPGNQLRPGLYEKGVTAGKYTVIVRALSAQGEIYSTSQYSGVVYAPTQPSFFENVVAGFTANPWIPYTIVGIILLLVVFFVFNNIRQKSLTGTPVMQGRLGGSMKTGGKGAGHLPLANEEPIPPTGGGPARPVPPQPAVPPPAGPSPVSQPSRAGTGVPPAPRPAAPPPQPPPSGPISSEATFVDMGGATMVTPRPSSPGIQAPVITVTKSTQDVGMLGKQITLTSTPFVIGRQDGVTMVVRDTSISRQHCRIDFDPGKNVYTITDLNSSNGSQVNGVRIQPQLPQALGRGTIIDLGPNLTLRFE